MIPSFTRNGLLPKGIYDATLGELKVRFGTATDKRKKLYKGLTQAIKNLANAGVKIIYINGSFVTSVPEPNDIDGCWDPTGVNSNLLDPVFLDFSNKRKSMKEKYGVDFFIANQLEAGSGFTFQDFFQISRDGVLKGIIKLDIN